MSSVSTPNLNEIPEHLAERLKELEGNTSTSNNLQHVHDYMVMLGTMSYTAQIVGTTQSVYDHYAARLSQEDPGRVIIDAMKELRLVSSWK